MQAAALPQFPGFLHLGVVADEYDATTAGVHQQLYAVTAWRRGYVGGVDGELVSAL